jgi:hypothetical protein
MLFLLHSGVLCGQNPENMRNPDSYICSDDFNRSLFNDAHAYDEFDSLADEMIQKGLEPEAPQEIGKLTIFVRKMGGVILVRYFTIKAYIKRAWYYLTRKNNCH